jgi:type VI secretion system secreted protein Hcp
MAYEFYVTIEGSQQGKLKGDSKRKAHKGAITGLAFEYAVTSPRDAGSGQATGRRQHSPITITKRWGAATPQLFQALVTNELLKSVLIEFVKTSPQGKEVVYHTVKLTNANVVSIEQYANPEDRELEEVSISFQKIEIDNKDGGTSAVDDWQTA